MTDYEQFHVGEIPSQPPEAFNHEITRSMGSVWDDINQARIHRHPPTPENPEEWWEFSADVLPPRSKLRATRQTSQIIFHVIYEANQSDIDEEISRWRDCLESALSNLKRETPTHSWHAVIGLEPEQTACKYQVFSPTMIEGISLEPLPETIWVPRHGRFWKIEENTQTSVAAMVARHSTPGTTFEDAARDATTQLNRICAALTIETGSTWQILESVQPEWISLTPTIERNSTGEATPTTTKWPDSVEVAVSTMMTTESVQAVCLAHHQAAMMEFQFPSAALVFYASTIETIGKRYSNKKTGSARRFELALALIVGSNRAKQIRSEIYDLRSLVAHEGKLYGSEENYGAPLAASFYGESADYIFLNSHLPLARSASRQLLSGLLTGRLPGRDDYNSAVDRVGFAIANQPEDDGPRGIVASSTSIFSE